MKPIVYEYETLQEKLLNKIHTLNIITTTNLTIQPLNLRYTAFILELTNTEGLLRFIGNRNINTIDDAHNYITKIINNTALIYYVVTLNNSNQPIGLLTVIKRVYLAKPDFGFAFLPHYNGGNRHFWC